MENAQKSLEQYFEAHGITDADAKAKLLPLITDLVYDRNLHIVRIEKENDEYKKQQLLEGIKELDDEIKRQFEN